MLSDDSSHVLDRRWRKAHKFLDIVLSQLCLTVCDPLDCSLPAPLSMGLSTQEYWSGLPFLSPEDLPDPGIKPRSPAL